MSGRLFFTLQRPDDGQPALCWSDGEAGEMHRLVDPAMLSDDETVSICRFDPSPEGRCVAYRLSEAGSDWETWRILDVDSGEHLPNELSWLKFPLVTWAPDGSGVFYCGSQPPDAGADLQGSDDGAQPAIPSARRRSTR